MFRSEHGMFPKPPHPECPGQLHPPLRARSQHGRLVSSAKDFPGKKMEQAARPAPFCTRRYSGEGYGSTRTMVGFGMPAAPAYATEPKYLVPVVRPLKLRLMAPVWPRTAVEGAVTVMFPASAVPSTHANSVKVEGFAVAYPSTKTV